jgi:hypothetical protein
MPGALVGALVSTITSATAGSLATGAFLSSFFTAFASSALNGIVGSIFGGEERGDFGSESSGLSTMVRQPAVPGKIVYGTMRLSGPLAFVHTTDNNKWLHMILVLTAHEVNAITEVFLDEEDPQLNSVGGATNPRFVDDDTGEPMVIIKKHLGSDNQTADTSLISHAPDKWTTSHRLRGNCYLYVRLGWKNTMWPNGIPNISATVQGKKVYDPRTASTTWRSNPALCIYDYLTNTTYGLAVPAAEINTSTFNTAANVCDESVALAGGGTQVRYTCDGVVDTSKTPKVILEDLLSAMAGTLTYQNGQWSLYAGEYRTPTVSLDESDLRGSITVRSRLSRKDLFNTVRGKYNEPSNDYQPSDFAEVSNSTYVTEDQGDIITLDRDYPFTNNSIAAQRLAKIELERVRQQITVEMPCKMTAFQLQVGDNVQITNARFGWTNKVFEVVEWQFVVDKDSENDAHVPGVNLVLRETASTVYTWSAEETTIDPSPDTDLPDPFSTADPTGLTLDSSETQLIRGQNGRIVSRIKVSWDSHPDALVYEGGSFRVQFRKNPSTIWEDLPIIPGDKTFTYVTDVDDRGTYDVRIRATNVRGGQSSWVEDLGHTVVGKTTPPPNVTGFNASSTLGLVRFSWDQLDILDVYGYEIRYGEGGIQWNDAIPLTVAKQGTSETTASVPPGSWSFLIKAVDYVGLYSSSPAVDSDVTVSNANTVLNAIADGDFPGTVDNFVRHYVGVLAPDDKNLASDYGFSTFDVFVPDPEQICVYTSEEIDLGSDQTVRTWGVIESALGPGVTTGTANPTLQICYRSDGDSSSGGETTTDLVSESGTFTNCILHYTGAIIPDSQSLANAVDFEVFDNFVYNPYEEATYEAPEVDYGTDSNLKLSLTQGVLAGPGETGSAASTAEIDTRTSSTSYDGFETFSTGTFNLRYAKYKITLNNTTTVGYVNAFSTQADCWRDWIIGDINNVRYIQARIRLDTDEGVAKITDFNWTIDQ